MCNNIVKSNEQYGIIMYEKYEKCEKPTITSNNNNKQQPIKQQY
jgi:hypothetical protein